MSGSSSTVYSLPPTSVPGSSAPLATASAAALLDALREKDSATALHSESVVELAVRVAGELSLTPVEVREVELTALLHDVGKLAIPLSLLEKPGALDDFELATMHRHTEHGERLVRAMPGLWQVAPLVRASHERWDGQGYPDGLSGEEIPLASRIVFVCDAYDAMTSHRRYRRTLPQSFALQEIAACAGSQFCPMAAGALIAVVTGPFRRLRRRSGRFLAE
ncbi:MAG TPA: HD-GYP domain-containing protein [Solirubrobacterales bacterium]|jgi:HD-GYP domain-containing protein (c-di-GMP phosphodiesterase class II)|nr:HD-GYP domain-containing protein [Solirubrobacterales bacterium]